MLADLVSVAGELYKHGLTTEDGQQKLSLPTICLHTDEFNEVAADEFTQLLNKGRGAGFQITAYTQTCSDIEVRLGSTAKAGQYLGNLNNIIMMRVKEQKTAELLINQLPKVPIMEVTAFSGVGDSPTPINGVYFNSSNEDRLSTKEEPMLSTNDLLNLPKGQAFCLIQGGQLYKIRIPLPKQTDEAIPETVARMVQIINQARGEVCHK